MQIPSHTSHSLVQASSALHVVVKSVTNQLQLSKHCGLVVYIHLYMVMDFASALGLQYVVCDCEPPNREAS